MEPRTLQYLMSACEGDLRWGSPNAVVSGVSTDSRKVKAGELFLALEGENFDGHNFLLDALSKRVTCLVVKRDKAPPARGNFGVMVVGDTRKALGRMAARYRRDFQIPVIAVGGSNGKTSTKEMIGAVLATRMNVVRSEASFNNDIGVPLTLLGIGTNCQAAVVEVGTNHPGELKPLLEMILPGIGVITSVAGEHLEHFGNLEGVVREEGVLGEVLPESGLLILGGDHPFVDQLRSRTKARTVTAGLQSSNDWRAINLRKDETGTVFEVKSPGGKWDGEYRVNLLGEHQVANALIALAVGAELGFSGEEMASGLSKALPAKLRLQVKKAAGMVLIDDCYNANGDSMKAALKVLQDHPCNGSRIAVLGGMAELGSQSRAIHFEVGTIAAKSGISSLITVGKSAADMAEAARIAGLNLVKETMDADEAVAVLKEIGKAGDVVLIKASRSMKLERVAQAMMEGSNERC